MSNEELIKKIWKYETIILDAFDEICRKNGLRYSLAYGTLIGAVRHKGFIPWDDDIDVMMPREDYDKLLKIWKKVFSDDFELVNHDLYNGFNQPFSKIVLKKTTFLQEYNKNRADLFPQGFFIDVFPCDRVATNAFSRKVQFLANAVSILYVHGYRSGNKGIIGLVETIFLMPNEKNRERIKSRADSYATKWNRKAKSNFVAPNKFTACKVYFTSKVFDDFIELDFGEKKYMVTAEYDSYLKSIYGNYMQLPPESERVWSHKPILIDFKHGYEELCKSKPIRVLQVIGKMDRGGAESMIMNLYRGMDHTKVQFDFLVHTSAEGKFDEEIKKLGGRIYRVKKCKVSNIYSYYRECFNFFKMHPEYKIVHGHIGSCASYYLLAAKKNGCFTIAHSHSADATKSFRNILYKISAFPTRYIADQLFGCSTEAGKNRYGKKSIKWKKYSNFANAIDLDKFYFNVKNRNIIRREFNIQESDLLIGTVGRITILKNPHRLYEIFKLIVTKYPNTKCIWVGTGKLENEIKNKIILDNLQDRIIMTGVRSDVNEIVQGMDCFLFPSLWEGLPVTVIEAQAAGLPCVLSDTISKEVNVTGLIEWLNLKDSTETWAARCVELAAQSKTGTRMSPKEKIVKSGYDIRETSRWLMDFYLKNSK